MKIKKLVLASLSLIFLTGCSDDDNDVVVDAPTVYKGLFVLNQGNMTYNIPGSITNINPEEGVVYQDVFMKANGRMIGDCPQSGIIYGGKMYVSVYLSSTLEIIDKNTMKSMKTISLTGEGKDPRSLAAKDGKVYVSLYDGYVARLDTASMAIDAKIKVGPNPDGIAICGNYLYVTNSDGMNYDNDYMNGCSVSKINLATFTEECRIPVGMNPTLISTNGSEVFVIAMGNYTAETPSMLQKLNTEYVLTDDEDTGAESLFPATMMAVNGRNIYSVKAPLYGVSTQYEYSIYNVDTKVKTEFTPENSINPQAIGIDPETGHLFISTLRTLYDYNSPCLVNEYTSSGQLIDTYETGVFSAVFIFD